MKKLLLLLLVFSQSHLYAQTCSCRENLQFIVSGIRQNYSGYRDKVPLADSALFQHFTDSLVAVAAQTDSMGTPACKAVLQQWIDFFKDHHMYLYTNLPAAPVDTDAIRNSYAGAPRLWYTKQSFTKYLNSRKKPMPLEGIWKLDDYAVGIMYDQMRYKAFIIAADGVYWMPGQVKFQLFGAAPNGKAIYYKRNHDADTCSFRVDNRAKTVLTIGSYGKWYKMNLATGKTYEAVEPTLNGVVSFRMLDSHTNVLTIKSFEAEYIQQIDSVVKANDSLLRHTKNLVIDVRGNGGGADAAYGPLKKLLYTNPYQVIGVVLYCSDDNIENFRNYAVNTNFSVEDRARFKMIADSMSMHKSGYWSPFKDVEEEKMDSVLPYPKNIAVLTDGNCGSTTEQFLMDPVKNSEKATIIGMPSKGVLDYANMNFLQMPCSGYEIGYATSRSKRIDRGKGIDNFGIQPDVRVEDKAIDLVKFAKEYLERLR